jgi:hypothetical protein
MVGQPIELLKQTKTEGDFEWKILAWEVAW